MSFTIDSIRDELPEYARDLQTNLGNLAEADHAPGMTDEERIGSLLTAAYSVKNPKLAQAIETTFASFLETSPVREAAKTAAAVMAMTNIYYRGVHLSENAELSAKAAGLRMTALAKPKIEKRSFELLSLVASYIGGCEKCVKAHVNEVLKHGATVDTVQSALRIASVVNGVNTVLEMEKS